ncbi:MAG: 4Fe-4S dicluster domain-containing protein [Firmicutes bacterium]|nr:4Fe-4S dicluster domain-containing protein [Bacillota bacterium]
MARVVVNSERCKGCQICCFTCPKNILQLSTETNSKGYNPVYVQFPQKCTGCALCALMCPDVALEVWK